MKIAAPSQDLSTRATSRRLGLEFVGERELTPDEIVELERETRKYRRQSLIFGWLVFSVYASPFLFGTLISSFFPGGVAPRYDHVTDMVVGFVVVPLLSSSVLFWMLSAEGSQRGKQGLGWDLRAGAVQQFRGHAREFKDRRFARKFFAKNPVERSEETRHLVEVLPHAQRVWKIDGILVSPWKVLDKIPKPSVPPGIVVDEALASSVPKALPEDVQFTVIGERDLTADERKEIERRFKNSHTATPLLQFAIGYPLIVVGQMMLAHFWNDQPLSFTPSVLLVPGVCLGLWAAGFFVNLRGRYQLRMDVAKHRALIVHVPTSPYALPASHRQGISLEILPNTGWILTSGERRPGWRLKGRDQKD